MSRWQVGNCVGLLSLQHGGKGKSLERSCSISVIFSKSLASQWGQVRMYPRLVVIFVGFCSGFPGWGKIKVL